MKLSALLTRGKGRDFYDAIFLLQRTEPDYPFLSAVHPEGTDLNSLKAFELLDSALHLHGFGGLVAEAFDELFGVVDEFLLVVVGASLLLEPVLSQYYEVAVIHVVVVDMSEFYFDGS